MQGTLTMQRKQGDKPLAQSSRLSQEEKVEVLRRILNGDAREARSRNAWLVLMGSPLDTLLEQEPKMRQEYLSLYRNSRYIKRMLLALLDEFDEKKRKSFGPGMFTGEQGKLNCIILTRYVLEEKLGMSFAEVMQKVSFRLLYKHRLRCAKSCFSHLADLITEAYPETELKPYYFKNYRGMWFNDDGSFREGLAKEALREFITVVIKSDRSRKRKLKNLPRWLSFRMFQQPLLPYDRSLSYLLNIKFGNSHIQAAMFAYPKMKIKPHYFRHVPRGYWKGTKGRSRAREVMQEFVNILSDTKGKYGFSREEALGLVKFSTLQKPVLPFRKRLGGMLRVVYGNSAPKAREEIPT